MKILAFDSSSPTVSIAVLDFSSHSRTILYHHEQLQERRDSTILFEALEKAIQQTGKPDEIVVGLGPGFYNGLRVSMAAAQGMSSALEISLKGIPSALTIESKSNCYSIIGDARGEKYWLALVINHHFIQEPVLLTKEEIPGFLDPNWPLFSSSTLLKISGLPAITPAYPSSLLLGSLAQNSSGINYPLSPLYLKEAHVTLPLSSKSTQKQQQIKLP